MCDICQKQSTIEYNGTDDYLGRKIGAGQFCSQEHLMEHIQSELNK